MTDAFTQSLGLSSPVIYDRVLTQLGDVIREDSEVLDLGCGKGEFLALLRSRGMRRLTGCDAYEYDGARVSDFKFVKADLGARFPFDDSSFDVVTAIEVIEHLENPRAFLREIHRVLRPGGAAVVTTPNNESVTSLVSLALRGYYSAFADSCYPAHISPLLEIDLKRMLSEAGFERIEIGWTNRGRAPGVSLHWQSVSGGLLRGKRFSDNLTARAFKR